MKWKAIFIIENISVQIEHTKCKQKKNAHKDENLNL